MGKRKCRRGSITGGPPEAIPWIWLTLDMLASPTWAALSISARRILDALMIEYLNHAGHENGNLAVTYLQLEAQGVTKADIRKGIDELIACGFIVRTHHGLRVAGGGEPSRFALTWLPTHRNTPNAAPAGDQWRAILVKLTRVGVLHVRHARKWLGHQIEPRVWRTKRAAVSVDIEGTPQVRGEDRLQVRGEALGNVVTLTPQVRGGAVRT